MSLLRQVVHGIHLICFSILIGSFILDLIFGGRRFEGKDLSTVKIVYKSAWGLSILTGIFNIILISKQRNYIYNKKYQKWMSLCLLKLGLTVFAWLFLNLFCKIVFPKSIRKRGLFYMRIIMFALIFILSGYTREYREENLKPKITDTQNKNTKDKKE